MDNIKVPFIITCQVTGIPKVYTSKSFVQRKLANYDNDMDKMKHRYVCKDARRVIRETAAGNPITVDHVAVAIKTLGGTADAATVFTRIQAGELDLKKIVKRQPKVPGAPKKSKATKKAAKKASKKRVLKKAIISPEMPAIQPSTESAAS